MVALQSMALQLDHRRRDLGMTRSALARQAGVGLRTVQRILSGSENSADFLTVARIANVLGMSFKFDCSDLNEVRRRQAERKAAQLVGMVQGTMALEAQGVEDDSLRQMKERTVRDLLAGSNRKLWD
jgi:transcriptional regulator with XRE-family HTH domain